ncbi:MAG TPA: hypothetical protein VMF58_17275 [Rhizomicrobium sp.]|nr:hypothetical protein [Rhizomicrobium sp.]
MSFKAALTILFLASVPAEAADEEKAFAALEGTFWRLETPAPGLEHVSIGFHDGLMLDAGPCEFSNHQFAMKDGRLNFRGLLGAGSSYYVDGQCDKDLKASNQFDWDLSQTVRFERSGDKLVLVDGERKKNTFVRIIPDGFEYRLLAVESYRDGPAMVRLLADHNKPTLQFASGQIIGRCRYPMWNASYANQGDTFTGTALIPEAVFCPGDALAEQQERNIVLALGKARRVVALPTGEFELRDGDDNVEILLSPLTSGTTP